MHRSKVVLCHWILSSQLLMQVVLKTRKAVKHELFQGPLSNSWYWPLTTAVVSTWEKATHLFRRCPWVTKCQNILRALKMSPIEPTGDPQQWRLGARNWRKHQQHQPWARRQALSARSLVETSAWGIWSPEDLLCLLQCSNSFDFTLYVASSLLSFVYLDSFI